MIPPPVFHLRQYRLNVRSRITPVGVLVFEEIGELGDTFWFKWVYPFIHGKRTYLRNAEMFGVIIVRTETVQPDGCGSTWGLQVCDGTDNIDGACVVFRCFAR